MCYIVRNVNRIIDNNTQLVKHDRIGNEYKYIVKMPDKGVVYKIHLALC